MTASQHPGSETAVPAPGDPTPDVLPKAGGPSPTATEATVPERLRRLAWGILAFNLLVIVWGAFVRATGSGAGCGSHWPLCNGEVVPQSPSAATLVELTHRLTSGIALILVAVMLVIAWRSLPKGHRMRSAALWSMIFMIGEAAVGAALVLLELVGQNDSITRAWVMAAHLCNTFLLLSALTATAWFGQGGGPMIPRLRPKLAKLAIWAQLAVMVLGASGAIAALGDTLYPPGDLATELREDFSRGAPLLKQLRVLHPLIAVFTSLLVFHFTSRIRTTRGVRRSARRWAGYANLVVVVQLAAGTLNILLKAPVWMQLLHLLLADFLWIALTIASIEALAEKAMPPSRATSA